MSESAATPALTAEQVSTITRQTNYGTWRFQKSWKPLTIADAEGCWFTDGAGKRYLDFSSQLMCVNLGHKNPRVVEAIRSGKAERGILMCGTGMGVCLVANKFKGVRAGLAGSPDQAYQGRHDDDINVLALAADFLDEAMASAIVEEFLQAPFAAQERYKRRIDKISRLEK